MRSLLTAARAASIWILLLPPFVGFLGAASNQLVLIANNDLFPVRENFSRVAEDLSDPTIDAINISAHSIDPNYPLILDARSHCLMTSKTKLNWLADNFDMGNIYSVGDFLLQFGDWLQTFCPFVWGAIVIRKLYC